MRSFRQHLAEATNPKREVTAFIRGNPPTVGHEQVYNTVGNLANQLGADHRVILSHSYDGIKNPLPPEVKLMHHQRSFPGMNIVSATPQQPSLLHHAADAYRRGVREFHVVGGQDRVDEFNNLLQRYNGVEGPHGMYNFKKIQVHSAGDRDPDAEGVTGVSGTSQRGHALGGRRDEFHAGAPSALTTGERDDLMNDLVKYTGSVAPKPKTTKKKSVVSEDFDVTVSGIHPPSFMPTSTGDVRGLGNVTGDPALTDQNELEAYWDRNMDAADASNDQLGNLKKSYHDSIHVNNTREMDDVLAQVDVTRKAKVMSIWGKAKPRGL